MTYSNFNKPFGDDGSVPEGNGGIFPVTSKYLTGNGKGRYVFIHSGTQRDSAKISSFKAQMYLFEKKNPNDTKDPIVTKIGSTITKTLGSSPDGPTDIMDVKSGLRVESSRPNDEYFVVASVRNYRLNIDNGWCSPLLSFFKLTEDEDGNATFSEESLTIEAPRNLPYTPVHIAVGDFTGEGITNQIAMATSDKS